MTYTLPHYVARPLAYLVAPNAEQIRLAFVGFKAKAELENRRLMDLEDGNPNAVRVTYRNGKYDLVAPWGLSALFNRPERPAIVEMAAA